MGEGEQRILVGDTVQTRRNDRLTGVENRTQWIVRGSREEFVDLVSIGDSGELRRASAEYAREHLQLAYASTVHGVQGDTADASVVGPDVDRGGPLRWSHSRLHKVAIMVARTDAAARECLAESMQRGTPELTMQDAVRPAQAETRRAARSREAAMATGPVVGCQMWGVGWGCSGVRFAPRSAGRCSARLFVRSRSLRPVLESQISLSGAVPNGIRLRVQGGRNSIPDYRIQLRHRSICQALDVKILKRVSDAHRDDQSGPLILRGQGRNRESVVHLHTKRSRAGEPSGNFRSLIALSTVHRFRGRSWIGFCDRQRRPRG
ncbi:MULTISPECIES: hypothetical protein [unclassified Microbacterium]|uniref:hypothetical protein n=1 Tax=unclassified Microbacterium TaxID=2609290 RepID=UPI00214C9E2B|nr:MULTISPECIES: hypothetical protein [unclassified Microbacterium]MCR2810621.1 hypothetical protein [Microbacterium sp. zg.B185]WIM18158.1 hypothetical protein QNO12_11140 [Microbacterium sp. zg-B185]